MGVGRGAGAGTGKAGTNLSKKVSTEGNNVCLTLSTSERICVMVVCSVLGS